MTSQRIAVLGSINMDWTVVTTRLPAPGETVLGSAIRTAPGGKGGNQAVASARSGAHTTFLGAVGDDNGAAELLRSLSDAGVDVASTRRVRGRSGTAVITVDEEGENSIVVVAGANSALTDLTERERAAIADADVLLCQFEIPMSTVVAGAVHAEANGTLVLLNPSPVLDLPNALLDVVDIVVLNTDEAARIGTVALGRIPHVITTLGSAGARYVGPNETFSVAAPSVSAVDTTGAGDAFTGALAAEWPSGPRRAVRWACAAGALAATREGASSGTREEIATLLERTTIG